MSQTLGPAQDHAASFVEQGLFVQHRAPVRDVSSRVHYAQPALLFLLTFAAALLFSRFTADTHHDGVLFKPALDVANGKMLFRDSFTQYGALTTLIQAWGIKAFGPYLVVIKGTTALFYALAAPLLWFNWSKLLPSWLAFLCGLLWLAMAPFLVAVAFPWSSVYALVFQLLSSLWLINALSTFRARDLLLCGAAGGLVFWCRQPAGGFHLLALILVLLSLWPLRLRTPGQTLRDLGLMLAGCASISATFLLWIVANDALSEWWTQSILFSLAFREGFGGPPSVWKLVNTFFPYPNNLYNPGYMWDVLPAATLVLVAVVLWRLVVRGSRETRDLAAFALCVIALSSWTQYYPFPDFMKAFWGAGIMVGLLAYLVWTCLPARNPALRSGITTLALALLYLPYLQVRVPNAVAFYRSATVAMETPSVLRGMMFTPDQAAYLSSVSRAIDGYLASHPAAKFINATTDALYLTFRDDRAGSYHPAYVKWGILQYIVYPDYQRRLLDYVARERPLTLVYLPPELKTQTGLEEGQPFVFNGEEKFKGYGVLQRFQGGITLIAPARCEGDAPPGADACSLAF